MQKYNGSYRMVCGENKNDCIRAWYNNTLSEKDLAIILHPENEIVSEVCFGDNMIKASMKMSMKPDMNFDYCQTFGEEKAYTVPFEAKSKMTPCNDNCVKEVVTYADGTCSTYTSTFTSQGYSVKGYNPSGYVGTVYFEKMDVSICGFFVMESHDNMDKVMMEDTGMSASAVNGILKSVALRVTECNGVYTMTDYMGDGISKTTHFKLGEEVDYDNEQIGVKGTSLVTQNGSTITNVFKDAKSGKTQIWEGNFNDDQLIMKVTKPLNTQYGSVTYRRYADIFGKWKMIHMDNAESLMKSLSMPDSMIATVLAERPTSCMEYIGDGRMKTNTGSSLMPDDIIFKSGEEFTVTVAGYTITQVNTLTKTGSVASMKMAGKTLAIKSTIGKTFAVIIEEVVGEPHTKATYIVARC